MILNIFNKIILIKNLIYVYKVNILPKITIQEGILEMINIYKDIYENNLDTSKKYNR